MTQTKKDIIKKFMQIPGVGKSISEDLWNLGYRSLDDLKGENPEQMYSRFCRLAGTKVDKCLLYVFRCAVYYVSNKRHNSELLKWWNWMDK